jgi:hypothetical protein
VTAGSTFGRALALQADGRIVLAGHTNLGDFPTDTFALARHQNRLHA